MKSTKQTDRRLEVTEAVWCVIVREGLDGTSMRAIAQELGCSTGVVTHYFRGKDELMLFALEQVFENLFEDMKNSREAFKGLERLSEMLYAVLPASPRGLRGWQVWVAFLGYAVGREHLVEEHQRRYNSLRQMLCQELAALKSAKLIRAEISLELEANALISLIDGIGTSCVINPEQFQPEQQHYLVQRHIQMFLSTHSK
ncbi:MAG: TetR/AcrR family transcriptional regulator [Cyanobacteria bacterium J06581_3]